MWRLAVAASVLSAIQFIIVKIIARFVHAKTQHRAFTGQWTFCMMGSNLGFTFPLVLAVPELADTVFPALVVWDFAGNAPITLVVNYLSAKMYSPEEES
eukprot:CAMPEP_0117477424 /NCGR_PEP_ID=MMETSP0784-20121206/10818_1 /TAXON_ID=39447 /ORGANISM="" /LENGTH=98 /DNA_ID=CAMNT_0005271731 /DNA_START=312 /DNA_END=604 /DNA_ORIENTATION=+